MTAANDRSQSQRLIIPLAMIKLAGLPDGEEYFDTICPPSNDQPDPTEHGRAQNLRQWLHIFPAPCF